MMRFEPGRAPPAFSEPPRASLAKSAVDVVLEPDVVSVEADDITRPNREPLELSSDLPPRKPAKRHAAALKKPRAVELVDVDTAPLMLNLEVSTAPSKLPGST
ncbi:Hypothetical protein NGAL_HAMBI1146_54000 [Neorhizobium galegae bv. officinalis]|nr:Hypothetical protein NGAL_HAMBI490_58490 [Neorhizobium galegae bv. officinalis]CDZ42633.1 Hypothetical protein NGAL_HAMBI1146_54000 [Neorhizobium galegae bv. officinalis]